MTDGGWRSERLDVWLLAAATVMSVLSENFRARLREHGFTFAAVSTILILLTGNQKKLTAAFRRCTASSRVHMQRKAEVVEEDAGDFTPEVPATLRKQFEHNLESFLSHIKFDEITPREVLVGRLWDKFSKDIRMFGKNTSHFEKSPKDLQQEIME